MRLSFSTKITLRAILIIGGLGLLFPTFGQVQLAVKNRAGTKKEVFYPAGTLVFQLKNDDTIYRGRITALDAVDSVVQVETASINVSDIAVVYSQKDRRDRYSGKMISAGILFPILDQFNNVVIIDNEFSWNRGVLIASGALITSGLAIRLLKRRKYRLNRKFKLVFVQ